MKFKNLLSTSILLFGLFCIGSTYAQNTTDNLSLKKGRIFTKDGDDKLFSSLKSENGLVVIKLQNSGKSETLTNDDIVQIDRQTGSKALVFAGVMGGSALLGAWLGVLQAEASTGVDSEPGSNTGIILGLTAAGAIIGALIGANKKTYKTIYENPKYGFTPDRIRLDIKNQNGISSLTFRYTF